MVQIQLYSTFQRGVMSTERKSIETMDYSLNLDFGNKRYHRKGRVFSSGGEGGPPLTAVFPPFRLAVIIVYYNFQKIIHHQDPPTNGSNANIPPLQNSLE